jgi:DNA-directed RNA polymerase specialized sigma24 family protein
MSALRKLAGIQCSRCREAGHFCQAQIIVDELALCLRCADDEPCIFVTAAAKADPVVSDPDPCVIPDLTSEDHKAIRELSPACYYRLDTERRDRIVELSKEGYAAAEIAHRLGVPRTTVWNAIKTYRQRQAITPVERQIASETVVIAPLAVFGAEMLEAREDEPKKNI